MPEQTQPDEIIIELKCAYCFNEIDVGSPLTFCTDACRMKGRFFPTEEKRHNNLVRNAWRKNNKEKARAIALKSYHKNKKLTGKPVGRPRKITPC